MITCSGIDAVTGSGIEIACEETIQTVRPARERPVQWIAPGWVDIQVNGFAGVDYNSPATTHSERAVSENAGPWKATVTQGSVGADQGTCA